MTLVRLLERDSELATLDECMASAAAGEGRLVVISGEAGVGKTALAKQLCESQRSAARIFWGQCDPLETPRALGPVLDIARAAGGSLAELAATDDRHELFSEFVTVWTNDSTANVVVLDDLQWADAATLDFLAFAGRRVDLTRCLLVVTCRDELVYEHPARSVLGDLATTGGVRRLRLQPLTEAAVAELAAPTGWDPSEVHRLSGGVPFVVRELLAAAPGVLTSVNDTVLARASQLDPAEREVLDAAALLPEGASVTLLTTALDASEHEIDTCVAAGLLAYDDDTIVFRHDLARQAIHAAMSPARRSRLHHRILVGVLETGGVDPAVCAHHAELAGDPGVVLQFAPVAARRTSALGAHREAAAQYERALRFAGGLPDGDRAALLDAYAAELKVLDRPADALEASTDALSCWRTTGDRIRLGDSLRRRVEILRYADDPSAAAAAGAAAIETLEAAGETPELAGRTRSWPRVTCFSTRPRRRSPWWRGLELAAASTTRRRASISSRRSA